MKLSLTQENLSKALSSVSRIVSGRSSLPVLSNVLLSCQDGRLRLAATNLEIGINYWIGCKAEQPGGVTVPARLLSEFVSNLPAGNLELIATETNLTLKTPHYESTINGIAADEFPLIPEVKTDPIITLPGADLAEAITSVVSAASPDETRPVFAGVYLHTEGQQFVLAATDSYRLAERRLSLGKGKPPELAVVVPARTMQELARVLGEVQGDVKIYLEENQIMFRADDIELVSRLIEGQYPPYQQIMPESNLTAITIDTAEMTRITKMASLFARENGGSIKVEIQAEGEVRIRSSASQVGESSCSAECQVDGDDGEISLNARYLTDALQVIKTEQVEFALSGKQNPCVVRPVGDDSQAYVHIIMPLRS